MHCMTSVSATKTRRLKSEYTPRRFEQTLGLVISVNDISCILQVSGGEHKCRLCSFSSPDATITRTHYVTDHFKRLPVVCGYCRVRLDLNSNGDNFRQHFKNSHPSEPVLLHFLALNSKPNNQPPSEDFTASHDLDLIESDVVVAEVISRKHDNDWERATRAFVQKDSSGVYKCRCCSYSRRSLAYLQSHVFSKHDARHLYECGFCTFGHNKVRFCSNNYN